MLFEKEKYNKQKNWLTFVKVVAMIREREGEKHWKWVGLEVGMKLRGGNHDNNVIPDCY